MSQMAGSKVTLESGWENPPNEGRLHAYWWWLNANAIHVVEPAEPLDGVREGGPELLSDDVPEE